MILPALSLIIGIGLLVAGRKLFWLFVAAAGFLTGISLANSVWQGPEWLAIAVGIGLGILFALLAMALKSIAIGLAGFLLGGSALVTLFASLGFERGGIVLYIVGGVLGVLLLSAFFDWALILISSFAGASMILQSLDAGRVANGLLFAGLMIAGVLIQFSQKRGERKKDD